MWDNVQAEVLESTKAQHDQGAARMGRAVAETIGNVTSCEGYAMFTVIGERINTTRKKVQEAVAARDVAYIQDDVKKQQECGATYIDVNAGARIGHEEGDMKWLLEVVQEVVTLPLSLDSPDPKILEMAYGMVKQIPMINSISLEKARWDAMIPFLKGKECKLIALCMDDTGMPSTSDDVFDRAKRLVTGLEAIGMKRENIFIDPLIQPVSTDSQKGVTVMKAVHRIMTELPGVNTACGLSNVSFGLPQRKIINRTFLALLMASGLTGAIIDPLDKDIMAVLRVSEMLLGHDNYCARYLKAVRAGLIEA